MEAFAERDVQEAKAFAAAGGVAIHLHAIIGDRAKAPACFVRDVDAGKPIAHLFCQDEKRLVKVARTLGVRIIKVERRGEPGQHIDLCGYPLSRAVLECDNREEAVALFAAFAKTEPEVGPEGVPDGG